MLISTSFRMVFLITVVARYGRVGMVINLVFRQLPLVIERLSAHGTEMLLAIRVMHSLSVSLQRCGVVCRVLASRNVAFVVVQRYVVPLEVTV